MTTAITTAPATSELTPAIVKRYLCPKATDSEVYLFIQLCVAQGLNPFLREAYLIKYRDDQPATMVVGKDSFTRRAEEHPQFDGFRAGIIVIAGGGEIVEREGAFYTPGETLSGGWAEVRHKGRSIPFRATVRLSEYDAQQGNWRKMPATMIRKVALVQALREAFPTAFRGLYDAAEMGMDPEALPTNVIDSTAVEVAPVQEPPSATVKRLAGVLGWEDADLAATVRQMYDGRTFRELTAEEKQAFVSYLQVQVDRLERSRPAEAEEGEQEAMPF